MDVVITDHHECKEELPQAAAVVNPHRPDCPYPFKQLAGVGVALKLALALTPEEQRLQVLEAYADLAAIGTVADVMSLTGENRSIVLLGLRRLAHSPRPGLQMLIRECALEDKPITSTTIGYTISPRLNAAGRMGCPTVAAQLLLTQDPKEGAQLARTLCELNRERQRIEQEIFAQCMQLLEARPELARDAIVLADKSWHQGVVGIVASRLAERFSVPAFMICLGEDGRGKGSCRSCGDLNLFHALEQCEDLLEGFGGHELAAGFTIAEENIPDFRAKMQRLSAIWRREHQSVSTLSVDAVLEEGAGAAHAGKCGRPAAAGALRHGESASPIFVLTGVTVSSITPVGKGRHTRLKVARDGCSFDAILLLLPPGIHRPSARLPGRSGLLSPDQPVPGQLHRAAHPGLDLRCAPSLSQPARMLYQRWKQGGSFQGRELEMLLPQRQDFVAVWRYLSAHAASNLFRESPRPGWPGTSPAPAGQRESYTRTMICLEVFQERGLLRFTSGPNLVQIQLQPVSGKVDLEASEILRGLRSMLK